MPDLRFALQDEAATLDALVQLVHTRSGAELVLSDEALTAAMLERALGRWARDRTAEQMGQVGPGTAQLRCPPPPINCLFD